jgi:hypothetical protein
MAVFTGGFAVVAVLATSLAWHQVRHTGWDWCGVALMAGAWAFVALLAVGTWDMVRMALAP